MRDCRFGDFVDYKECPIYRVCQQSFREVGRDIPVGNIHHEVISAFHQLGELDCAGLPSARKINDVKRRVDDVRPYAASIIPGFLQ